MKISFVVAVYNNERALSKTHERIASVCESELAQHEYEIVFVDDGSKDGSLPEILGLRALDSRVKVCIDICCLTDFQALMETGNLKGHGIYYFVPSLLKHFTTAGINALIAPRAHLSLAGNLDALTPPAGLERIDRELKKVYAAAGRPDNWKLLRYDAGHQETAEGRREILAFLKAKL